MEIAIIPQTHWNAKQETVNGNVYTRVLSVLDSQEQSKTLWYIISLIAQGVLFLPVPAMLIYYFNAPIFILVITLSLYFANIIAGMGGAGIRVLLSLFSISVLVHLLMCAIFIW